MMTPLKFWVLSLAGLLTSLSKIQPLIDHVQSPPERPRQFQSSSRLHDAGRPDSSSLRLPLVFEPNFGQTDPQVRFLTRSGGMTALFTRTEAVMVFGQRQKWEGDPLRRPEAPPGAEQVTLRMKLVGAQHPRQVIGLEKLAGVTNYFIGNDPKKWRTNVPTYRRLEYRGVYPGVDIAYYGQEGHLEYDLIVAPGADPSQVELAFEGAEAVRMDSRGNLRLHTAVGQLSFRKPLIYQEEAGIRHEIAGAYVLRDEQRVAFRVDRYDPRRPLVIDPVLEYSTFLGPRGGDNECGYGIAVDSAGNAYITGISSTIPATPGSVQPMPGGSADAFVAKLNSAGTALIYSTYLGGNSWEQGLSIAVDPSGNAYVSGVTYSKNFPVTPGAMQPGYGGDGGMNGDAFVAKLNPAGTALIYSTYLGGRDGDSAYGIALDTTGNAYVAGRTCSDNFPTTQGALQRSYGGGASGCAGRDAFLAKLNVTGTALLYSTYLGGSDQDVAFGISVDAAGNAYVTGYSWSAKFPFTGNLSGAACKSGYGSGGSDVTGFVTKLSATGGSLIYSICLDDAAGSRSSGSSIAVDSAGNAYVTGSADSYTFPTTPGAFRGAGADFGVFVMKLNPTGKVVYSTGLGPADAAQIAVDMGGSVYVSGYTSSSQFPVTSDSFHVDRWGRAAAFLTKLNTTGTALVYSTLFGEPSAGTGVFGMAADAFGNVYVTGQGAVPATWGAFRTVGAGTFVAKFADRPSATTLSSVSAASLFSGSPLAPGSIASAFGQGLATTTEAAGSPPLPTSLAGTKVLVKDSGGTDRPAPLYFVSPGQINYLIPEEAAVGPAVVTAINGDRQVASGFLLIDKVGPGLFSANGDGRGVAAAVAVKVAADGTQTSQLVYRCGAAAGSCVSVPIDLGGEKDQLILSLFGTGIRGAKSISFLGLPPVTVLFAGAQGQYPGLDQVNIRLPRSLIGRGEVEIGLSADGRSANIVTVNIK